MKNIITIPLKTADCCKTPISNLSITFFNPGSIKNKTKSIRNYIIDNDIDIMAFSETWLYAADEENAFYINQVTPNGYEMKDAARQDGRIGGGVALIFKKSLHKVVIKSSSKSACVMTDQFEYMICDVFQTSDARSKITIVVVYRPSPTSKNNLRLKLFWKDWLKFARQFASNHREVIIVGDLNFHLNDINNSSTKKFNSILTQLGLVQHISKPTHTAGNTLDVLITKPDSKIVLESIVVHDPGMADDDGVISLNHHFALSFSFYHSKPSPTRKLIRYRNLRDINKETFEEDLLQLQLPAKLSECSSVDDMVVLFESSLLNLNTKYYCGVSHIFI